MVLVTAVSIRCGWGLIRSLYGALSLGVLSRVTAVSMVDGGSVSRKRSAATILVDDWETV